MSDELQFEGFKQQKLIQILKDVGPFQIKDLNVFQYIEGFLEKMNLENVEPITYDPHKVISNHILENKYLAYMCTYRPGLENIANKDN